MASWLCARPRIERSGFEPWPGTLCCVLGQDTFLSQYLSPPRSINGYRRFLGENLTNCWGVTCNGLASRPGGVEILLPLHATETGISSGPMSQLAQKASLCVLLELISVRGGKIQCHAHKTGSWNFLGGSFQNFR